MLNNISIMGYLAADPDLRSTPSGKSICRFAIGCTRPTKDRDVDFFDIVTMNSTADFVNKWFKKGDPIVIVGRLQNQFKVESDGRTTKKVEVMASGVDFVPRIKEKTDEQAPF